LGTFAVDTMIMSINVWGGLKITNVKELTMNKSHAVHLFRYVCIVGLSKVLKLFLRLI
jgi:hypothetical protein